MSKPTQKLIEDWLTVVTGPVHYTKACDGQFDKQYWPHLRMIFSRLHKEGILEPCGGRDGFYQIVDTTNKPVDWQNYSAVADSGLVLPFDLRKYVFIYYDTVTVVAGSKSSGKTGFLYRTVVLNMDNSNVVLLTNMEGGLGMLRDRFNAMEVEIPKPAPFRVVPCFENFHHHIKEPNTVYVIDYIDAPEGTDFYLIGAQVKNIANRLEGLNSVAVIGLQKPFNRDIAFGGEQTLKAATLYLALDSGKLKIIDAKVPANKNVIPKNLSWSFTYDESGTKFSNIQRLHSSYDDLGF